MFAIIRTACGCEREIQVPTDMWGRPPRQYRVPICKTTTFYTLEREGVPAQTHDVRDRVFELQPPSPEPKPKLLSGLGRVDVIPVYLEVL